MPDPTDPRTLVAEALARYHAAQSPAVYGGPYLDALVASSADVPALAAALTTLAGAQDAARGLLAELVADPPLAEDSQGEYCVYCERHVWEYSPTAYYVRHTGQPFQHAPGCRMLALAAFLAGRAAREGAE